jgi:ribosome-associated protein
MEISIRDEFIKLGQALKLSGMAQTGSEAKMMIEDGIVCVNGEAETRRGRKLYDGDTFAVEGGQVCTVRSALKKN